MPGDPLYLETTLSHFGERSHRHSRGHFVQGEITEAKRAAKGKGGAEVRVRLTSLVLPNGYTAKFDAVPTNAGTGGSEYSDKNKEGQITNDRDKAADAGTVHQDHRRGRRHRGHRQKAWKERASARPWAPLSGLAAVFSMRGPDAELPRGSSFGRHAGPAPLSGRGQN